MGPVEWLQPYTEDALQKLADEGVNELVVVPISFVSEHIETLQEIDMEYREVAEEAGIEHFHRVPALNTHPVFIDDLGNMVLEAMDAPSMTLAEVMHPQKQVKMYPPEQWEWGMTVSAEVWNGRLAMVGILAVLMELLLGRGPLHAIGLL